MNNTEAYRERMKGLNDLAAKAFRAELEGWISEKKISYKFWVDSNENFLTCMNIFRKYRNFNLSLYKCTYKHLQIDFLTLIRAIFFFSFK